VSARSTAPCLAATLAPSMAELLTDDQVRAAMQFLNGVKVDLRRRPRRTPPAPPKLDRACTDCGLTLPLRAFVRIRSRPHGYYGRCRACRARRARERYQTDPSEREAQKARVRRNSLKRK